MKNFNESKCIEELYKQHWEYIYFFCTDPNAVWELWRELFLEILNKHAPLQHKKIKSNKSLDYKQNQGAHHYERQSKKKSNCH